MRWQHRLLALACAFASQSIGAQTPGAALFEAHCSACHQADGSGTVGLAPALKGAHWLTLGKDRQYLPTVLTKGLSGRIEVNGQVFVGSMPAFASQLDDADLALLAKHVRVLQNSAETEPPFTAAELATARQTTGSPPQTRQRRQALLGLR
jgi:mono/diheme cytochrome c family protein